MEDVKKAYELAKKVYKEIGVDTDKVLEIVSKIPVSMQCWQGDDINGFLNKDALSGGIQVTGNYLGKSRTVEELRNDMEFALKLIPGHHKVSLHAIYLDTDEKVDLDEIAPRHYKTWVDWAKRVGVGLDFNPTCFGHPKSSNGTLSSNDEEIRKFWINHVINSRKVGEYFGKELGIKCATNIWIPDGSKDVVVDTLAPRKRLEDSLNQIFSVDVNSDYNFDAMESKLFGIGAESYTVGSNEFYLGYAAKNNKAICLDAGHFHPTEVISDKISSALLFTDELLLHVSRPVRWDSDHVVVMDDELLRIAQVLVRNDFIKRTHIGLDYFDASINRVAAWVIGMRNMIKALLRAYLEPTSLLMELENEGDYTSRLALVEELKCYPWQAVYDYYCMINNVPIRDKWLNEVKDYEEKVLKNR